MLLTLWQFLYYCTIHITIPQYTILYYCIISLQHFSHFANICCRFLRPTDSWPLQTTVFLRKVLKTSYLALSYTSWDYRLKRVHKFMLSEYPWTSNLAQSLSLLSISMVVVSTVTFIISTADELQVSTLHIHLHHLYCRWVTGILHWLHSHLHHLYCRWVTGILYWLHSHLHHLYCRWVTGILYWLHSHLHHLYCRWVKGILYC